MASSILVGILITVLTTLAKQITNGLMTAFNSIVGSIIKMGLDVLDYKIVNDGILYAQGIALVILGTKIAYEAVSTYILYSNGDSNADPQGLLLRGFYSAAIICTIPWLMKAIFQLGGSFAQDIMNINGLEYLDSTSINLDPMQGIVTLVLFIVAFIFIVIILIQTFVRVANFAMLSVIGSFMALNITSTNAALFRMWWKEVVIVSLSQALQIFMIKASMYTVSYLGSENSLEVLPAFIGFLWVTYKTPAFLNQFKYSTGMGSAAGGVAQHVITSKIAKVVAK